MLSIAHGLTGALIATKVTNPFLSVPLIIASHFLEDMVPHWDFGTGINHNQKDKKIAFLQELFIDLPLTAIFVYIFFPAQPLAWLGMFIGILPDLLEAPYIFLNIRFPLLNQFFHFHSTIHHSFPKKFLGLLPQLAVILAVFLLRKS